MIIDTKHEVANPALYSSPVTWHVILWTLLCLAVNSMSQPSGRICGNIKTRIKHRSYLCSSPILCLVDAFDMIIRFLASIIYLRISPRKACQLVILGRSEGAVHEGRASILPLLSKSLPKTRIDKNTYPRLIFFVIGTLPAAIKLASFSGLPWTQAWGMMFISSFAVIELFEILGRSKREDSSAVQEIFGLDYSELENPENDTLHAKIKTFTEVVEFSGIVFILAAIFTHLALLFWAAQNLLSTLLDTGDNFDIVLLVTGFVESTATICFAVFFVGGALLKSLGWFPRRVNFGKWLLILFLVMLLTPSNHTMTGTNTGAKFNKFAFKGGLIMLVSFGLNWLCHQLMSLVCEEWPKVGRVLLIDNEARRATEEEVQEGVSAEKVTGVRADPIDDMGWLALCIFVSNITICTLWYAYLYKSVGTINPSWTDVFG